MTTTSEQKARTLFLDQCGVLGRGTLERYGEQAAVSVIAPLIEALEAISERCPPFDGDPYALASDFNNSREYAFHVEAMIAAGTGDIAREALSVAEQSS